MKTKELSDQLDYLGKRGAIPDRLLLKVIARILIEILKELDDQR